MPQHHRPAHYNRLLATLPADELAVVTPELHFGHWKLNETIYDANGRLRDVYFPLTAVASNIVLMENGSAVEASTVGREGMVGAPAALGTDRTATKVICQVPGEVARMRVDDFRRCLRMLPRFCDAATRFNVFLLNVSAQSAACNRLHNVEKRLARWLLMTHDRILGDDLPLTHELLSIMLGVNRPAVTLAIRTLREAGLITRRRGMISIENRPLLEKASCECYDVVAAELDEALPQHASWAMLVDAKERAPASA
ncbi:MAG: Crp/Fnr family transcriptional regulator [Candidatus Eremiobacteraeota bacterium]|nr:Crp/Fnr family transcriptional regulator [Candidatus Eremiobacteraeota bacterium]